MEIFSLLEGHWEPSNPKTMKIDKEANKFNVSCRRSYGHYLETFAFLYDFAIVYPVSDTVCMLNLEEYVKVVYMVIQTYRQLFKSTGFFTCA